MSNIWLEIPKDLSLWRRPACQTLSKSLDISSAKARVAPGLLKALAILPDATVRRSAVDGEDLKPYIKGYIFQGDQELIIYKFFKDFTNHWKKTNMAIVFSCRPSPYILKYRDWTTNETFQ